MKWTDDQQRVIASRDCNLLVSAAAGSGKTAVLVERILQIITDERRPADVDDLLIVTFTNAAASQMREKISAALYKKQEESPGDTHLVKQLSLIHKASIMTIDSFCLQVVRENFQQAGLDPGFRIAEAAELSELELQAMSQVLEQHYAAKDRDFLNFVDCYGSDKSDASVEQYIRNIARAAASYPRPYEWLCRAKEALDISDIRQMEEKSWYKHMTEGVCAMVKTYIQDAVYTERLCREPGGPENFVATCRADIGVMEGALNAASYDGFRRAFSEKFPRAVSVKAGSCDPEKAELVKKLRKKYKDGFESLQFFSAPGEDLLEEFDVIKKHMQALLALAEDYMRLLDEKKLSGGILDFSDVEHYALKILVDENGPTDIAGQYQNRYKEILIDEYQDSNFLQEEILTSICGHGKNPMFMVGDVKQSIYRFRMARPDLFMDKYAAYQELSGSPAGAEGQAVDAVQGENSYKINLQSNFRSRAVVLDAVNYIFYQIMGEDFGGIAYNEAVALVPGFPFPEPDNAVVSTDTELLILDMKPYGAENAAGGKEADGEERAAGGKEAGGEKRAAGDKKAGEEEHAAGDEEQQEYDKIELEARMVAQRICQITGMYGNAPLYVLDEDGVSYRKAEFKDIAILLRSVKNIAPVFVRALSDAGIPVVSELSEGLFHTQEIKTLISCLWVIHNPFLDIELAAVLHSPLFSFSSSELAQIRIHAEEVWRQKPAEENESYCFYDALCLCETGKARSFLDMLSRWQEQSRYMDVSGLLWDILQKTGYLNYLQALEGGTRRLANVHYLISCARRYASDGKYTVSEFLQYIEQMKNDELDLGEANVHGDRDNIVRIMSMHKSKGLEFPVVFVSGLGRQFNQTDSGKRILVHPDDFLASDYAAPEGRLKKNTFMHMAFAENIKTENIAEEFRVFYVALTRAKEKLILTGSAGDFAGMADSYAKVSTVDQRMLPFGYRRSAKSYMDWIIMSLIRHPRFHQMVTESLPDQGRMRRLEYSLEACELPEPFELELRVYREGDLHGFESDIKADKLLDVGDYFCLQQKPVDEAMLGRIKEKLDYRYPYAGLASKKGKYSVTELKAAGGEGPCIAEAENQDRPEEWPEWKESEETALEASRCRTVPMFMQGAVRLDGANRGTLIHRILQMLDFTGCTDRTFIEASLEQWRQEGILPEDVMDYIDINEFTAFFDSELGRRMIEAEKRKALYKEKQFTVMVPMSELSDSDDAGEDEPILVQGIIDAYFIDHQGDIVVVDYKTDRGRLPMEQYEKQLKYYARTLERLTHKRVAECYVYALTKKEAIPVMLSMERSELLN